MRWHVSYIINSYSRLDRRRHPHLLMRLNLVMVMMGWWDRCCGVLEQVVIKWICFVLLVVIMLLMMPGIDEYEIFTLKKIIANCILSTTANSKRDLYFIKSVCKTGLTSSFLPFLSLPLYPNKISLKIKK